jgi:hypothetical protein
MSSRSEVPRREMLGVELKTGRLAGLGKGYEQLTAAARCIEAPLGELFGHTDGSLDKVHGVVRDGPSPP